MGGSLPSSRRFGVLLLIEVKFDCDCGPQLPCLFLEGFAPCPMA